MLRTLVRPASLVASRVAVRPLATAATTIYTTEASSTGGRNGTVQNGALKLNVSSPGPSAPAGSTNPEVLFSAGYAACFGSALGLVYKTKSGRELPKDTVVNCKVNLNSDGSGYFLSGAISVKSPSIDAAALKEYVETAHTVCPYSKAVKGNAVFTVSVIA